MQRGLRRRYPSDGTRTVFISGPMVSGRRSSVRGTIADGPKALSQPASPGAGGFSLLELLVVIAIILIVFTLYWSPNTGSKQRALKAACQANLQKIHMAFDLFANEHSGKLPAITNAHSAEEPLDLLVPQYTSDTSFFICPASSDSALPAGEPLSKHKISYAYYMGRSLTNGQAILSDRQVDTRAKVPGQQVFSTDGKPPGNNHKGSGGNFLFGDGHVESSSANTRFALPLGPGEALLNPNP